MELFNQQLKALNFRGALLSSMQPVQGDLELEMELRDEKGVSTRGMLAFVTAYVIESDSNDSVRLKMDRVYFQVPKGSAGGKILKISLLFEEDEKQANITFEKYGSNGNETETFSLTIKCLMLKWVGHEAGP